MARKPLLLLRAEAGFGSLGWGTTKPLTVLCCRMGLRILVMDSGEGGEGEETAGPRPPGGFLQGGAEKQAWSCLRT